MKKVFYLFGGSPKNLRARKLLERWRQEGMEGVFIVTGYPNEKLGELESMIQYLLDNGVHTSKIFIDASYDTLSNVESLKKFLVKFNVKMNQCKIFASTGPLHWSRFNLIFAWELRYGDRFNFFDIEFIPSREREVWYAIIAILLYILLTPTGWQMITRILRKKEYELCKNSDNIRAIAQKYGVKLIDE
ncbi:YdcF family protein [bacterium]|nr:YdcF family protein [bacterium]